MGGFFWLYTGENGGDRGMKGDEGICGGRYENWVGRCRFLV